MCGRFDLTLPWRDVARAYDVTGDVPPGRPRFNIAPTQESPIVLGGAARTLVAARFGLRPDWWAEPGRDLINVRTESLKERPYFARLARSQRCLVPATGFFEWHHAGRHKTPYRFVPCAGGLLSMAGLFLVNDFGFRRSYGFAVLTCPANALVAPVHDRMPVLLDEAGVAAWLADDQPDAIATWLKPAPEGCLCRYQVSNLVSSPEVDDPALIVPLAQIE